MLGVSGGASLGYAAVVLVAAAPGPALLTAGAMAGAAAALALVTAFIARRDMPPERVLLVGIAVSALAAIMARGDARAFAILGWLAGTSSGVSMAGALALAAVAAALWAGARLSVRWLAILPLGAGVALGLGLPVRRARAALIVLAGLATGAATVLVIAPHLGRRRDLARPADQLTGAALIGAGLMLAADFGARMAGFPYELPLGLFAALVGAPWLVFTLTRTGARR